ncbi:MAG TPA: DUF1990 domain-containing protein [Pyrinomonadaceae bacterium]|nr:DUF1990 domain-containing protein [Pyrinomonadaceae bacterium]
MFLLREPSIAAIENFLSLQRRQSFSYPHVGASRGQQPPQNFVVDHNRVRLGAGEATFAQAVAAIRSWRMFDVAWCRIYPPAAPLEVGTTVAIVINHFGFWSLNACRIVYLLEEAGDVEKYGFAYGTLPEHGEAGEERFSVEWNRADDSVWYDLYAFSRPQYPLSRIGYPLSRMLQKRFARESKLAMSRACG